MEKHFNYRLRLIDIDKRKTAQFIKDNIPGKSGNLVTSVLKSI
jgi:hypothetical protein